MKKMLLLVGLLSVGSVAQATETTNYQYDALGRVKTVTHSGGPADGVQATYNHDAADNRTNVTVTGAHPRVVVVPLNGFTVIPLTPG